MDDPELGPLPRGRHHLTRQEVRASQRQRILRATIDEVAERGYTATSVAHITARAGVSRKSFYEQFTDKRDCYLAAYDLATQIQQEAVRRAAAHLDPATNPIEYFRAILGAFLEGVATNPSAARTLLVELYAVGPEVARLKIARRHDVVASFLAPLGFADGDGELTFEGRAIVAAIACLVTQLVAEDRASEVPELTTPLVDWVAHHL